jgi:hypothetical protein
LSFSFLISAPLIVGLRPFRLAAFIDTRGLRLGDPFKLPLAAKVRLEFSEHPEHV